MSPSFKDSLALLIGHTSLARGKQYADGGRVDQWDVAADQQSMRAIVHGSESYRVLIEFTWSAQNELLKVSGHCTCPMVFNCKHVAASVLVAAAAGALPEVASQQSTPVGSSNPRAYSPAGQLISDQTRRASPGVVAPPPAPPQAPPMSRELRAWLTQFQDRLQGLQQHADQPGKPGAVDPNHYPPTVKDRIRYVVEQSRDSVTITPVKVSVRKNGSISPNGARPYAFRNLNQDNAPKFVRPIDLRIFRLLSLSERDFYGYAPVIADNEEGQTLLRVVLESGRAFWNEPDGLPLQLGAPCNGRLVWRDFGETQQLMVKVDDPADGGAGEQWFSPLPLIPAWYLDTATGQCGFLETDCSPEQVKWLASAPPVPASQADQVLAALSQARMDLPRPKPVSLQWITDIKPRPVLTLSAVKARQQYYRSYSFHKPVFLPGDVAPMLRLSFDYDGHRIDAGAPDAVIRQVVNGQIRLIERHQNGEAELLDNFYSQATEYYFYPVDHFEDEADMAGHQAHDLVLWPFDSTNPLSPMGGGHIALDFMTDVVPWLEAQNWTVIIDASWPCQIYEGTPLISGGIKQQEDSWFSVGLNVEVEGQEFDLLPVLANLVESIPEDVLQDEEALQKTLAGERFVARLKDGRYARLPLEPLLPALRFIRDLNQRMHAAQAGAFTELAQALAGSGIAFEGGQQLQALGERLRDLAKCKIDPNGEYNETELPTVPDSFVGDLRPYQKTGMGWLLALAETGFGGILADDMGLGKTVQTLAFLALKKQNRQVTDGAVIDPKKTAQLPCLLVVPTSLVSNWTREARRFVPNLSVLALHGPDRKQSFDQISQHDLIITTYPLLHRDSDVLFAQDFDTVILDEAQHVKNPTSQVSKLIRLIPTKHRLALTGTPMENNLEELWCLFDWLIPGLLGNRKSFGERFRKPIEKEKNLTRQVTLSRRIAPFILRRTKDQVVTDLPPRTEIIETVQLTGPQRALYETVRSTMHERVRQVLAKKGLASSKITVLDALLKLRQVCCDPQLVKLPSAASITVSAKRMRLLEMLESLIAEGRRVLIFSQFVEMLRLIEIDIKSRGWDYLMLTGQTQKRGELVEAFQTGKAALFLISLKAGGVGLNLTAADTVILYDPWWNPAIERQAMDRVHRIGQDKPVFVHRLIAEGTVETRIAEMQARKQALIDSVFDPQTTNTMDMNEDDILSLFAPVGP